MTDISVFRDKVEPDLWRVEEKRAREYAEWLESKPPRPSAAQALP